MQALSEFDQQRLRELAAQAPQEVPQQVVPPEVPQQEPMAVESPAGRGMRVRKVKAKDEDYDYSGDPEDHKNKRPAYTGPLREKSSRARTQVSYAVGDNVNDPEDEARFIRSLKVGNSLKADEYISVKNLEPSPKKPKRVTDWTKMTDDSGSFHFDTVLFDHGTKYEIEEEDGNWREATVYRHRYAQPEDGSRHGSTWTIVIWFGGEEYEGMDGKYTINESGVMKDTDGDIINCRKMELPLSKQLRMIGDYQAARNAELAEAARAAKKK